MRWKKINLITSLKKERDETMINPSPSININETMTRRIPRIISRCCAKIVQGNEKEKLIRIKRTFRSLPPFFKLIKNKNSQNKIYPLSSIQSKKSRLIVPLSQNKFFFSSPNSLSLSLSFKKTHFQARFQETKHWVYRARSATNFKREVEVRMEQRAGGR